MLIGNLNRFAVGIEPLEPSWERKFLPEFTAWARFSLWINGENICRNLLDGSNSARDGINVPLAPIADWFVRSWTFLEFEERPRRFPLDTSLSETIIRWGEASAPAGLNEDDWFEAREHWWSRHFLSAGADGAYLPNLSLIRGDERLFIEWAPVAFNCPTAPKFLSKSGRHIVAWAEGKDVLSQFVSYVAQCLRDSEVEGIYSWACQDDPLNEAIPTFSETLQAYTGLAIENLRERMSACNDDELREKLRLVDDTDPGSSVITQVLRDLPLGFSDTLWDQVLHLENETRSVTGFAEELRSLAHDAIRPASDPETSGYLAAQEIREHLDINGQPVGAIEEQLGNMGVKLIDSDVKCTQERMFVGSRQGCGAATVINRTPRTSTLWGRRFEAARGLGHLLMDPYRQGTLGAASTAFAQPWARRRAGAFAAEFLLPSEALREDAHSLDSYAEPKRFENLMEKYEVGAMTAAYHLWNRGFLSSSQIRDDLIDQFSSIRDR